MTIDYDPLLTDIFKIIREKIGANSTLTGLLGSYSPTDTMRVYRHYPPKAVSYPLIVMNKVGQDIESNRSIAVDFFINLIIYNKNINKANIDTISRELMTIFGDPNSNTSFNKNNTKIDQIILTGFGAELWDDKNKVHFLPVGLNVKARRKNHLM